LSCERTQRIDGACIDIASETAFQQQPSDIGGKLWLLAVGIEETQPRFAFVTIRRRIAASRCASQQFRHGGNLRGRR